MGIRFLCPNGHKLNVKTFLAGKRGICPHWGATFEIPFDSVASAPPPPGPGALIAASGAPAAMADRPVAAAVGFPTAAGPAAPSIASQAPIASSPASHVVGGPASAGANPMAGPLPRMAGTSVESAKPSPDSRTTDLGPLLPDPLAEAPTAVWYVRTAAGGQFGPARGEMMRQWLDERRIGPDYLVWREGWPEWKRASTVFAKLAALAPAVPGAPGGPHSPAALTSEPKMDDDWVEAIIESQSHPTQHHHHKPKPKSNNNLILAIRFVVVLLGLILIVVVIVKSRSKDSSATPPAATSRIDSQQDLSGIVATRD